MSPTLLGRLHGCVSTLPRLGSEGDSKAECHECQKTCHVGSSSHTGHWLGYSAPVFSGPCDPGAAPADRAAGEDAVPVVDQELVAVVNRGGFAQLLQRPLSGGVRGHIGVQDAARVMFHDHKHIQEMKRGRDHQAKVARDDHLGMIAHKREPAMRRVDAIQGSDPWACTSVWCGATRAGPASAEARWRCAPRPTRGSPGLSGGSVSAVRPAGAVVHGAMSTATIRETPGDASGSRSVAARWSEPVANQTSEPARS